MKCPVRTCRNTLDDGHVLCRSHWFGMPANRRAYYRDLYGGVLGRRSQLDVIRQAGREVLERQAQGRRGPFGESFVVVKGG